jgi:hypothetical protein
VEEGVDISYTKFHGTPVPIDDNPFKRQGIAVEDAGKRLEVEFKTKYPTWPGMNVSGFVRSRLCICARLSIWKRPTVSASWISA